MHQTRPEEALWERLRGSRFYGAKFRRQVPFDRFTVDFYCHAAKLAIELRRQAARMVFGLERLGLHIVRFTNDEVSNHLESVLAKIHPELRLPFD